VKSGIFAKGNKVAIIGKITFHPRLRQDIRTLVVNKDMIIKSSATLLTKKNLSNRSIYPGNADLTLMSKWNKYFIREIPKTDLFLRTVYVFLNSVGNSRDELYINCNKKITVKKNDTFIYIGDLHFYFEKDGQCTLEIRDNYNSVRRKYSSYLKTRSGRPILLKKRLLTGRRSVSAQVIRTTITMSRY